jgi:hypothetical protein
LRPVRNIPATPATRFANKRPLIAIQGILTEHGKPIPKVDLCKILIDGGITIGKKRAIVNIEEGLRRAINAGSLICTGKEELIGLPKWVKKIS